jgi:hypothetical protein
VIRLFHDGNGGLRFAGKNREAERRAAAEIRARKRGSTERLHAEHMALLGTDPGT